MISQFPFSRATTSLTALAMASRDRMHAFDCETTANDALGYLWRSIRHAKAAAEIDNDRAAVDVLMNFSEFIQGGFIATLDRCAPASRWTAMTETYKQECRRIQATAADVYDQWYDEIEESA